MTMGTTVDGGALAMLAWGIDCHAVTQLCIMNNQIGEPEAWTANSLSGGTGQASSKE